MRRREGPRGERRRIAEPRRGARRAWLDALLVQLAVNVRYLTGFTGSNGLALVAAQSARRPRAGRFFTDFRYATQSADAGARPLRARDRRGRSARGGRRARPRAGRAGALGFDDTSLTVRPHRAPARAARPRGGSWCPAPARWSGCARSRTPTRSSASAPPPARRRGAAQARSKRAWSGRSERDVAIDLELRMRRLGAEAPSFPSIVAAGAHGALPHAVPREEPIARGRARDDRLGRAARRLLLGLHAHLRDRRARSPSGRARPTRSCSPPSSRALAAVRAGPSGREVDAVAREVIERGRPGRALRPRPRPRRGPGGPRGAAALADAPASEPLRAGQRRDGRAGRLPARAARRANRGPRWWCARTVRRCSDGSQGAHGHLA